MFSGICAVVPPEIVRMCHICFLKEKGQITRLPKDATPKENFFYTKTSSVFILIFIQKQRVECLFFGKKRRTAEAEDDFASMVVLMI